MSFGIAVLAVLFACSGVKAGELTKAEVTAKGFAYNKTVGLGTTLEDFKTRLPEAALQDSDKATETETYLFQESSNKAAQFIFFRRQLYDIGHVFLLSEVAKLGGRAVLDRKMEETFGRPHDSDSNGYTELSLWVFPKVHRVVQYTVLDDGVVSIGVYDSSIEEQIEALNVSQLDLGF